MKRLYIVVCAVGFLGIASAALGSTALPYASGFEGAFNPGVNPWSTNGGTVGTAIVDPKGGTQTCIVSNSTLTLGINADTYSNAWIQIWAKPVAGTNDPTPGAVSGAFYIKNVAGNGHLMVYTGTPSWLDAGGGYPTGGGTWIGFAAHVDYVNNKWDLYSAPSGSSMTKVASNLPRAGGGGALTAVSVESGDQATIDQVAVAQGFQSVTASSPNRVMPYEFAAALTNLDFSLPVYSDTYTNGNNTLAGVLGNDLKAGLTINDYISIWAPGWTDYTKSGVNWSGDTTIEPTTAIQIYRQAASPVTWGFFAYNQNQAVAFGGVKDPVSPTNTYALDLYGPGTPASGFTAISWASALTSLNDTAFPVRNPAANLARGDRIYKVKAGNPNAYDEYYWNGTLWMFTTHPANDPVPGGANMWVKRANPLATVIVNL